MIQKVQEELKELYGMKKYPVNLYYLGNLDILYEKKISIVGSRKPNQYARNMTQSLATQLVARGVKVVSGGAIGIDAVAHKSAGSDNTIMVAGTGLDVRYPSVNKALIEEIELNGLVLSQFEAGVPSRRYNFPLRNELIVALGDILVVAYADLKSGTMRSIEYALEMGKEICVFPHRIGESDGTNYLLKQGLATPIYDIDVFCEQFGTVNCEEDDEDEFLSFCRTNPNYEDVVKKDPQKVFEYELLGKIKVVNAKIYLL